jgi:hypothetical protein
MPLQSTSGAATYDAFGVSAVSAVTQAEAIDFDGTNDYLSRSSDLVGNTDGRTFTFSAWVWNTNTTDAYIYANANNFYLGLNTFGRFVGSMTNTSGTVILDFVTPAFSVPINTWTNVLVSIDLTNSANRSVYINDIAQSVTWTTYSNQNIDFTKTTHYIDSNASGVLGKTRLSNVYLDKTYRDLSNVTNRRLFVTADLKPALGQAALNPIMYLPMSNPTAPGTNSGTGGDFALTGVVARSGRGPNQYNAPYSDLDGSADYLTNGTMSIAATKVFTLSVCINSSLAANVAGSIFYTRNSSTSTGIELRYFTYAGDTGFFLEMQNAAGSNIFSGYVPKITTTASGRNYILTLCIDMDSQSACRAYINGVSQALTISNFTTGQTIRATNRNSVGVTADFIGNFYNPFKGRIGAFWFNPTYVDLSAPANLAKFVTGTGIDAKPVDLGASGELPTGTSPLVYLPMYGNDAGRNYGTGGNFTVNSGPYTGARGPNEFWGNWRRVPSGSGFYIRRTTGLVGATNVDTFTCSVWFYANVTGAYKLFFIAGTVNGYDRVGIVMDNGQLKVRVAASTDTSYVQAWQSSSTSLVTTGNIYNVLVSRTGSTIQAYVNGVSVAGTASPDGSGAMTIVDRPTYVGASNDSSGSTGDFWVGEVYFNTHYTDFSQEANRLLFRDAFGNPTNLPSLILGGSVPNPLVYLRTGPANPGENSGTGGAFTSTLNTDRGQF